MVLVGFTLQPEREYCGLLEPLLVEDADYFEVTPETTWVRDGDELFRPNGFWRLFRELGERTGKPFIAHGVGLSLGTFAEDGARLARCLEAIRMSQEAFRFLWYTDHLGATVLDGRAVTIPVPLPMTSEAAAAVRDRLGALQEIVPDVGFENSAFYYLLGKPLEEPAFFGRILERPRTHLLLDLHNLFTNAVNLGFDAEAWLERLDLTRVIEIHVSGGSASEPEWLPSRRVMRLDSHDAPVPEEVWRLLERTAPRCPNLRGVTLERMEGTVGEGDVPLLREELARVRRTVG
ncbi:MAG: DUF692 domain-containing protein [Planctomycetes bacterium]|nr:DUF692 domain-containing protein [Planctomycetota bacterium]